MHNSKKKLTNTNYFIILHFLFKIRNNTTIVLQVLCTRLVGDKKLIHQGCQGIFCRKLRNGYEWKVCSVEQKKNIQPGVITSIS